MKPEIKIVKRDQRNQPKQPQPQVKGEEQNTREMVMTIKKWVTELKERKVTLSY
jgi:hypothetical protein